MGTNIYLILILLLQTIVIIGISIAIFLMAKRINQSLAKVDKLMEDVKPKIEEISDKTNLLMDKMTPIQENVLKISENLVEASETVKEAAGKMGEKVNRTGDIVVKNIEDFDLVLNDMKKRLVMISEAVTEGILTPIYELSAILKGVKSGINMLLGRDKKSVNKAILDEEMFI